MVIDASQTITMHPDVIEIIEDFKQAAPNRDITLDLIELEKNSNHDPVVAFGRVVLSHDNQK